MTTVQDVLVYDLRKFIEKFRKYKDLDIEYMRPREMSTETANCSWYFGTS